MKSTVVDESLSSMNLQFCSRENQLLQLIQQNEKPTQIDITMLCDLHWHERPHTDDPQTKK